MKRSILKPGALSLARGTTFSAEPTPLKRTAPPKRPRSISPASLPQRRKAALECCVVCGAEHCDPAHLIDRSLGGDDDPRSVVALCRPHHREYDDGALSLLEYLEPHYRTELAYAVELVGLITALERITNQRWRAA
jgi:hypothetical protein